MQARKEKYILPATIVLAVLYAVGVYGMNSEWRESFLSLTPLNLLLSLIAALFFYEQKDKDFLSFVIFTFLAGYLIEVIGVNTTYPFGEYDYGEVLGFKIFNTPPMIGVNWLLLVYASASFINRFLGDGPLLLKSFIGGMILLLLDFLIEPVAIELGFWEWEAENIPLQNYISWFLIAFGMHIFCFKKIGQQTNKVALVLLILQFLFFGILNLRI